MIRYSLACNNEHHFEAWFSSSDDYDAQNRAERINCPVCGSSAIGKSLMAPSVVTARKKQAPDVEKNVSRSVPVASSPALPEAMLGMMRQFRDHVTKNADNVGKAFAEEARKIHFGEADERGIYGEASVEEVENLHDDGIEIFPLPVLPEDRN